MLVTYLVIYFFVGDGSGLQASIQTIKFDDKASCQAVASTVKDMAKSNVQVRCVTPGES